MGPLRQTVLRMLVTALRLSGVSRWRGRQGRPLILADTGPSLERPVSSLAVFQKAGRIHERGSRPDRVLSFAAAQERLLSACRDGNGAQPVISLRLGQSDRDWTDVLLNGAVVVQVPTAVLVRHCGE